MIQCLESMTDGRRCASELTDNSFVSRRMKKVAMEKIHPESERGGEEGIDLRRDETRESLWAWIARAEHWGQTTSWMWRYLCAWMGGRWTLMFWVAVHLQCTDGVRRSIRIKGRLTVAQFKTVSTYRGAGRNRSISCALLWSQLLK